MARPRRIALVALIGYAALMHVNTPSTIAANMIIGDDVQIYNNLRSGDAEIRQQAAAWLRDIVQFQPETVSKEFDRWIKPLLEAKLYEEVLRFTSETIVRDAANASLVADQEEARVQALLGLGQKKRALVEAKSAFNVAMQRNAGRAIDLIIRVLHESDDEKGEELARQFASEVLAAR